MNRLQEILNTMDIPEQQRVDLYWLKRNTLIRNTQHSDFKEAEQIINELLK